jgi:hypothetical protein
LKRYIRTAQLDVNGPMLQSAGDIVIFLREKLSHSPPTAYADRRPVSRTFWHIREADVDRAHQFDCEPIVSCRHMHSVRSVDTMDVNKLLKRGLACFFPACINCNWAKCENIAWTRDWMLEVLIPHNPGYVWDVMLAEFNVDNWDEFGLNGTYLASILELGDNLAICAAPENEENVEFYILMYTKKPFVCTKAFTCVWGETFEVGDSAIEGTYYQKYGTGHDTYVLQRKSQKAYVAVENVRAVKFPMLLVDHRISGNDPVYKLQAEVEEAILEYAS